MRDAQSITLADGSTEILYCFGAWFEPVALRKVEKVGLGYLI